MSSSKDSKDSNDSQAKGESNLRYGWWTAFFVLISLTGLIFLVQGIWLFRTGAIQKYSDLGGYVAGMAGSLWALAGVILIYLSFKSQQRQSSLQAREFQTQNEQMQRQSFESTFFQLLRLHGQIVAQTDTFKTVGTSKQKVTGHDAFEAFYEKLKDEYNALLRKRAEKQLPQESIAQPRHPQEKPYDHRDLQRERARQVSDEAESIRKDLTREGRLDIASKAYSNFYEKHQYEVGHYFRNLYHVIKFVKEADDEVVKDKRDYTNIVRAQLSSPELLLLAHNGLMHGKKKFKPMMERYGLLKQMPEGEEITDPVRSEYDEGAFRGRDLGDTELST